MRYALLILAAALSGCVAQPCDPAQTKPLTCLPCSGDGAPLVLQTLRPVPIGDIVQHDLCFAQTIEPQCWYGCPGTIDESVFRGPEVCDAT